MKQFAVLVSAKQMYQVYVTAENPDEAKTIAEKMLVQTSSPFQRWNSPFGFTETHSTNVDGVVPVPSEETASAFAVEYPEGVSILGILKNRIKHHRDLIDKATI